MKKLFAFFLFVQFLSSSAHAVENQYQLNGFRLHQYKKAIAATLGEPFQTGERGNVIYEAYSVSDESYMVFEILKEKPHWIASIQITGSNRDMLPFVGLKLGDGRDKVIQVLGEPEGIREVEDMGLKMYTYGSKNYTVEINDRDELYSIRIQAYNGLFDSEFYKSFWDDFKSAVLKKDFSKLAEFFRPDVEIYRDGEALVIAESFHNFFRKPEGKFYEALLSETGSVYEEIHTSEPEGAMRLIPDFGVGHVFKFLTGTILEEIVFFPYAGKIRIYEIKFRD